MKQELSSGLLLQLDMELDEISFKNLSHIKKTKSVLKRIRHSLKKLKSYLDHHPFSLAESHPLLKEISYERESQGELIVKLTDPHLKDSGISFRAVLALVLSGIYYEVWQPESIKVKSVTSILMMKRSKLLLKRQLVRSLTPYGN